MVHDLFIRFPNGLAKAFTLSYDDGTVFDKPLIEMFNKYNVKGTLNLNSQRIIDVDKGENNTAVRPRLNATELKELLKDTDHEVAVHTCTHPSLISVPQATMVSQIVNDRDNLEKMFGRIVRGMAYPNGTWAVNDETIEACKVAGIVYSRGTRSTHSFDLPMNDFLHFEPTCHHNDKIIFDLIEDFNESNPRRFPYLFYVWGHSYEFDDKNNWDQLENILINVANKDDVWYATNIEIFDYINAFKQLQFSVNMDYVHNPTSTDIWFTHNYNNTYVVKSGETIKIS